LYFHAEVSTFWDRRSHWQLALEGGIIGPWAGGASVQSWWHKLIHYTQPKGWQYQIRNEAVINFMTGYQRAWQMLPWAELLTNGSLQAGTAFNNFSLGLTARMGQINPIDNSAMVNSLLNNSSFQKVVLNDYPQEWFFFYGIEGTRVLHNTLIEGSLFPPIKSLHTEKAHPYIWTQKIGVVYSAFSTTFKLTLYTLSPEVLGGKNHQYLRIDLVIRF
jgi:hypothetical protein